MRTAVLCVLFCSTACLGWTRLRSRETRGLGLLPGPAVRATKGEVWPKPQQQTIFDRIVSIDAQGFSFQVTGETCLILTEAVARYKGVIQLIRKKLKKSRKSAFRVLRNPLRNNEQLNRLQINLTEPCETVPFLHMNEQYSLLVSTPDFPSDAQLTSQSVWGVLRGLETFVQLIYYQDASNEMFIHATSIEDYPRFPHRGFHLDTARHFIPLKQIFTLLDAMAINKLNVFHWHIVDDQSFPYESRRWPELSARGAYSPLHVYTQVDIARVLEFAHLRGIRVIPEFDTPGHTRSWGIAHPELLTPCYDNTGLPDGSLGPMHPLLNSTYSFMENLIQEVTQVFQDDYIHLGGDEVPFDCWLSNPEISKFMNDNKIGPTELEEIYIQRVINFTSNKDTIPIVWQEVFDNDVRIPQDTVVHVWKDWIDYMNEMADVTRAGYRAILSSCWYLDRLSPGGDWEKFYTCDPTAFSGSDEDYRRVLGGEACMWTEVVDSTNLMTRIWPRAAAAAEVLWSPANSTDVDSAAERLEEHSCRMNMRGVPSQPPNGPGFCPFQLYN